MAPNAVRVLHRLGFAERLDREGVRPRFTHQRFRIAQVPVGHNMLTEMARPFFAIQGTLLVGPETAEMVLRWSREFNDRSRRACSRGHERRCRARSAIGRCPSLISSHA